MQMASENGSDHISYKQERVNWISNYSSANHCKKESDACMYRGCMLRVCDRIPIQQTNLGSQKKLDYFVFISDRPAVATPTKTAKA